MNIIEGGVNIQDIVDIVSTLAKNIEKYIDKKIENAKFDKTKKAKIIKVNEDNYEVFVDGNTVSVDKNGTDYQVNTTVPFILPENNFSNRYISAQNSQSSIQNIITGNRIKYDINGKLSVVNDFMIADTADTVFYGNIEITTTDFNTFDIPTNKEKTENECFYCQIGDEYIYKIEKKKEVTENWSELYKYSICYTNDGVTWTPSYSLEISELVNITGVTKYNNSILLYSDLIVCYDKEISYMLFYSLNEKTHEVKKIKTEINYLCYGGEVKQTVGDNVYIKIYKEYSELYIYSLKDFNFNKISLSDINQDENSLTNVKDFNFYYSNSNKKYYFINPNSIFSSATSFYYISDDGVIFNKYSYSPSIYTDSDFLYGIPGIAYSESSKKFILAAISTGKNEDDANYNESILHVYSSADMLSWESVSSCISDNKELYYDSRYKIFCFDNCDIIHIPFSNAHDAFTCIILSSGEINKIKSYFGNITDLYKIKNGSNSTKIIPTT